MRKPYGRFVGAGSNPVQNGRKFCTVCGRYRLIVDFSVCRREPLKLSSWCAACTRAKDRAAWRDPNRVEHKREYHRIWREGERRRRGVLRREDRPLPLSGTRIPRLPAQPLVDAVLRAVQRHYAGDIHLGCEALGIEPRAVLDWRKGVRKDVQFDTADKALIGLGLNWWDVWEEPVNGHEPEKRRAYELAQRAFEGA